MGDTAFQGPMVGAAGRVGFRIPLGPPAATLLPPAEVMRRLPTGTALYIAMMSRGHEGPSYRLGKTLATMRRRLEELWAKATLSKA